MNYFHENKIKLKQNTVSEDCLYHFYLENDKLFYPKVSTQVHSLKEYVEKLTNRAILFES
jgi:hypothetical protein